MKLGIKSSLEEIMARCNRSCARTCGEDCMGEVGGCLASAIWLDVCDVIELLDDVESGLEEVTDALKSLDSACRSKGARP